MGGTLVTNEGAVIGGEGLKLGDGSTVKAIKTGTVSIDPPSIGATSTGVGTGAIPGVAVGDVVLLVPPSTLNDDLVPKGGARVTGADAIEVSIYNPTAGAIDDTAKSWTYIWFDLT